MDTNILVNSLFVILLSIYCARIFGQDCPTGWLSSGTKCYLYSNGTESWSKAQEHCKHLGGTLAAVNTPHINDFLRYNRSVDNEYWIGLYKTSSKHSWYWNNGTFMSNSFVLQDDGVGTCARIERIDKLNDKECNGIYYFICQTESQKESPWIHDGKFYYYFSDSMKSHYDATMYCWNKGAYLARDSVRNVLTADRVGGREYWLGISRRYWTDRSGFQWYNFEVQSSSQDDEWICFVLDKNTDRWTSIGCRQRRRYICSRDMGEEGTTSITTASVTSTQTSQQITAITDVIPVTGDSKSFTTVPEVNTTVMAYINELEEDSHLKTALTYTLGVVFGLVLIMIFVVAVLIVIYRRRLSEKTRGDERLDEGTTD